MARILAKDAGDDDFIESDEEVDPELMAEKVYEDVEEAREGTGIYFFRFLLVEYIFKCAV